VDQTVTHTSDLRPWDVRMPGSELKRKTLYGFFQHCKAEGSGLPMRTVIEKMFEIQSLGVGEDIRARLQHVFQRVTIGLVIGIYRR
jgi:hypothetical protein